MKFYLVRDGLLQRVLHKREIKDGMIMPMETISIREGTIIQVNKNGDIKVIGNENDQYD